MKLRSTIIIATLAAATMLIAGCKKDGIYRPSDKLARISEYYEKAHQRYDPETKLWRTIHKDSTARLDKEKWAWDGKQLHHIDIYSQGTKTGTVAFVYDGNRLARANFSATGLYAEYTYDGRKLSSVVVKNKKGETEMSETFEYDGKKISTIHVTLPNTQLVVYGAQALMPVLGDAQVTSDIAAASHKAAASKALELVLDIAWKGDNIRSVTDRTTGGTTTYSYDDKTNPLRGLLTTLEGVGGQSNEYAFANRNNIIAANYGDQKMSYTFTYSTDLPTSRSRSVVNHYTQGYRYVETTIQYFEYVEE